jgi:hypothetical protein
MEFSYSKSGQQARQARNDSINNFGISGLLAARVFIGENKDN